MSDNVAIDEMCTQPNPTKFSSSLFVDFGKCLYVCTYIYYMLFVLKLISIMHLIEQWDVLYHMILFQLETRYLKWKLTKSFGSRIIVI